jgi:hypothetical protein
VTDAAAHRLLVHDLSQTSAPEPEATGKDLSFAEELLWRAEKEGPAAPPFFDCARSLWLVLRLQGPLDLNALQMSLNAIIQRHDVLRSRFAGSNGQPFRLTSDSPSFSFTRVDRPDLRLEDPREIVKDELRPSMERRFDLVLGPLLQAALMALNGQDHMLAIAVHHIVFDRWSKRLLELELNRFYCAFSRDTPVEMRPLSVQYQDYVVRQRELVNGERGRKLSEHWMKKLGGVPDLVLPCDGHRGREISARSGTAWFTIPAEDVAGLALLSRQARTTMAATMLAIFTLFLHRLSGMDDFAIGVPLSDRRRPELEEVIGLFMNVVVVRTAIPCGTTFLNLLDRVRRGLVDACLHQDMPYGYLRQIIPGPSPYRVVFNFMPKLPVTNLEWAGLKAEHLTVPAEIQSLADFSLQLRHDGQELRGRFVCKADLISKDRGQSFAFGMQNLTKSVLQSPGSQIDTYSLE